MKFFVFTSRSKTMHIASFLISHSCFSVAQIAKTSLLAPHSCITRQLLCFARALQLPTFCLHCCFCLLTKYTKVGDSYSCTVIYINYEVTIT